MHLEKPLRVIEDCALPDDRYCIEVHWLPASGWYNRPAPRAILSASAVCVKRSRTDYLGSPRCVDVVHRHRSPSARSPYYAVEWRVRRFGRLRHMALHPFRNG